MKRFITAMWVVLMVVLAGACEDDKDTPQKAERKAECRRLEEHIIRITPRATGERPETDPARIAQLMAKVPIEDIEQCAAIEDHKVIECMQGAADVAALRACIPAQKE